VYHDNRLRLFKGLISHFSPKIGCCKVQFVLLVILRYGYLVIYADLSLLSTLVITLSCRSKRLPSFFNNYVYLHFFYTTLTHDRFFRMNFRLLSPGRSRRHKSSTTHFFFSSCLKLYFCPYQIRVVVFTKFCQVQLSCCRGFFCVR